MPAEHVIARLGPAVIECEVARDATAQARGLQGRASLRDGEGMVFPFAPPRSTTFHMGTVAFPIDIAFVDTAHRVARVVTASPGTRDRWSHHACAAVVEVPAGFCARAGVRLGQSYNVLRSLTDSSGGGAPGEPQAPGEEEISSPFRDLPRDRRDPSTRFEDRKLPDEAFSEAHDQPIDGYRNQWGYQPTEGWDGVVGPLRAGSRRRALQVEDFVEFAVRAVESAAPRLQWRRDPSSPTESATLPITALFRAFESRGADAAMLEAADAALRDLERRGLLADAFTLSGLCDLARVAGDTIVLTRGAR